MQITPPSVSTAILAILTLLGASTSLTAHAALQEGAGREWFVAPSGKDSQPGTAEQPLASLGKAAALATPGSTIRLAAGVYREREVMLRVGGTAQRPLVIEGAKNGQTVLKGSTVVTGWRPHEGKTWKIENWTVNIQQLFADGRPLQQIGVQCSFNTQKLWADHVALPPVGKGIEDLAPGSFFYAAESKTLYVQLPDGSDPNAHEMEASTANYVLDTGTHSHIVLRNLAIRHSNATAIGTRAGVLRVHGKSVIVEDCEVSQGDFAGISMEGDSHIIRRSRITENGSVGIDINGSDAAHGWSWHSNRAPQNILMEDLEITGNNYRLFYNQWHAGGMKCIPSCRAVTVRRCRVTDNLGSGIWFDGALGEIRIEDNLVARNTQGIFYEIAAPAAGDAFGALIRNNRVIDNGSQGIYISASAGAVIANNTCDGNEWDIVLHGMPRTDVGGVCRLRDNQVRDNIVRGRNADIIAFIGKDSADNVVDGNFYAAAGREPPGARFSATAAGYSVTRYPDLGELFKTHGFEEHGLQGDPLWVDAPKGDYRLKPGSPATGKGWQEGGLPPYVAPPLPEKTVIPLALTFAATPDGPFSPQAPTVAPGTKVWVRVSWEGFTRPDKIAEPYLIRYWSVNDFANALEGQQKMAGDKLVYANRPDPYYLPRATTSAVIEIDTGARSEGTMGTRNRWDREKNAYVGAPLAALPELGPGAHEFTVSVYYYQQGKSASGGTGEATFSVTVSPDVVKTGKSL